MRRFVRLGCLTAILLASGVACNLLAGHEPPILIIIEASDATKNEDADEPRVPSTPDVTTCAAGQASCSAGCTSLSNDLDNCGRCGRRCDSVPCAEARCPARLVTTIGPWAGGLAERGAYLYWTTDTDGTVKRIAKSGGTAQTLATLGFAPSGLALRDGFVYVATQNGTIKRVPEEGGEGVLLATTFRAAGLAIHAQDIFFAQYWSPNGQVGRVPIDGGSPETLAVGQNPLYVAANETAVYFAAYHDHEATAFDDRGIWRVSRSGTGLKQLVTARLPSGLPIDEVGVYSADLNNGILLRVDHGSGAVTTLAKQSDVAAVVVDQTYMYFASTSGAVGKVPKTGGSISVLAVGPPVDPYTAFLTVDDQAVFWTAEEKIWRTPK